jgi:RimJ/RimL family protein N-acetyltransferase
VAKGILTNLYVHPNHQGRGAGAALLAAVKLAAPRGFELWTFQPNQGARRFYERHGLITLQMADGSDNEEGVPDLLMAWRPVADIPMDQLRDLSDTEILSDRLALRAFAPGDALDIFPEATPEISRYMTWEPATSLEAFSTIWPEWLQRIKAGVELSLVVRQRLTGEFLGLAGLHNIGIPEPTVGIWIKQSAHRLGYGRESIAAIITWASAKLGARACIYPVVERNIPSRRLAESLKGVVVGTRELRKPSGTVFQEVVYRIPIPCEQAVLSKAKSDSPKRPI